MLAIVSFKEIVRAHNCCYTNALTCADCPFITDHESCQNLDTYVNIILNRIAASGRSDVDAGVINALDLNDDALFQTGSDIVEKRKN